MKLVYDISVLGAGHYNLRARTGICRVVEHLADGLKASKECDLVFSASQALQESLDYLESSLKYEEVPLPYLKIQRYLYIKMRNSLRNNSLYFKAIRKSLYYTNNLIKLSVNPIEIKSLSEADIFHSPFYPIPDQVRKTKHLKKFITIYDLIPVLHPKFFKFKEDLLLREILNSVSANDWIICISNSTKNDLCNYINIDPSRVFVNYLSANPKIFYPCFNLEQIEITKKKYHIPANPYILSLSTLEPRKNIDHLIRCFVKMVQEQHILDLNLVLVGPKGWDYGKIFKTISQYDFLKDRIVVTGYVDDDDLAALYSGALTFVYPSFYEGFGLPPLEAMQCGVPVITSNTSSLPEVVGDAGIMLDPKDVDGLCHNMFQIYNSSSLKESMKMKSIERAKHFSWQRCTQETILAYQTALLS